MKLSKTCSDIDWKVKLNSVVVSIKWAQFTIPKYIGGSIGLWNRENREIVQSMSWNWLEGQVKLGCVYKVSSVHHDSKYIGGSIGLWKSWQSRSQQLRDFMSPKEEGGEDPQSRVKRELHQLPVWPNTPKLSVNPQTTSEKQGISTQTTTPSLRIQDNKTDQCIHQFHSPLNYRELRQQSWTTEADLRISKWAARRRPTTPLPQATLAHFVALQHQRQSRTHIHSVDRGMDEYWSPIHPQGQGGLLTWELISGKLMKCVR